MAYEWDYYAKELLAPENLVFFLPVYAVMGYFVYAALLGGSWAPVASAPASVAAVSVSSPSAQAAASQLTATERQFLQGQFIDTLPGAVPGGYVSPFHARER